jgi:hypothetical protein
VLARHVASLSAWQQTSRSMRVHTPLEAA